MSTEKKLPVKKIRDGLIEAAIWRNETDKGHFYSASITNAFVEHVDNNDIYHSSNNYTDTELLQLRRIADKAYDAIVELRQAEKAAKKMN